MTEEDFEQRPVRGRFAKQERSERTRHAIVEGVISALAEVGACGLTHRLAAQRSGASLAATTYYFRSKNDLVAEASNALLHGYLADFRRVQARISGGGDAAYLQFIGRLTANGLSRRRTRTLAWLEIMLDGARDPHARALAQAWFARFTQLWEEIARAFHLQDPERAARTGIDFTIGALVHGLSLGWDADDVNNLVLGRAWPDAMFRTDLTNPPGPAVRPDVTAKSLKTRARLEEAAIALLAEGGAPAVTYRAVAERAGVTRAAPAYHFRSSAALLAQAQRILFARQKARYRDVMAGAFADLDISRMTELTAAIFDREAVAFGPLNLAGYAIWMEAARWPDVRGDVERVMSDLYHAWKRLLATLGVTDASAAAQDIQFLFVGAQIRVLAGGCPASEMADTRRHLTIEVSAIAREQHWLHAERLQNR